MEGGESGGQATARALDPPEVASHDALVTARLVSDRGGSRAVGAHRLHALRDRAVEERAATAPVSEGVEPRVLVVESKPTMATHLRATREPLGYAVSTARCGREALARLEELRPDALLSAADLSDVGATEFLHEVHEHDPALPILMATPPRDIATAVSLMRHGASDCLEQPVAPGTLLPALAQALRQRALDGDDAGARRLRAALGLGLGGLIGESEAMRRVYEAARRVAPASANVLLGGETGTGKGELARAIHALSGRRGRFVPLHCASLSPSLLESELFGHEKGAYTGADHRRAGRFELAEKGTLFLDEVADIPLETQAKLLHVLQHKSFERVGGEASCEVDFRLVTATHRVLRDEVVAGRFREDLYYRLNVVNIDLPPLRERGGDIALLSEWMLRRHARSSVHPPAVGGLRPEALSKLACHGWPGNVRELENAIERAAVMCGGGWVGPEHVELGSPGAGGGPPIPGSTLAEIERHAILATVEAAGGSTQRAAQVLGLSQRTLQYRLRAWGLARTRGRPVKHRGDGAVRVL